MGRTKKTDYPVGPPTVRVCLKCREEFNSYQGLRICLDCSIENDRVGRLTERGAKHATRAVVEGR